jgi:uncharacterized protein (TIGR02598 family)
MNEPSRLRPVKAAVQPRRRDGFSLIEVTTALGVMSFCFVSLLGLIPASLTSTEATLRNTTAAGLAAAVVSDLRAAPDTAADSTRYGLSMPPGAGAASSVPTPQTFYVGTNGLATAVGAPATADAQFRVSVEFMGPAGGPAGASRARVTVSWPALATAPVINGGRLESFATLIRDP